MSEFNRRKFLKASALGLGSIMAPAVMSSDIKRWPGNLGEFFPGRFLHGVASGDPLSDAVILWTRVTPMNLRAREKDDDGYDDAGKGKRRGLRKKILVGWEVATDPRFRNLVRRGYAAVSKETDYTLKVDVVGLNPATTYYYRFRTINKRSPVGVTKTLPTGDVSSVTLAVMSCANYPTGYFNAYQDAAQIPDLDAVVHLGDYIYEYGEGGYATELADEIGRGFEPGNETELLSLENYRERYAQYRTDPGLQALHAAAPFICVWDDHEVANNAWKDGAENHNAGEGDYSERKQRALQAYYEWLPIRPVVESNLEISYRDFQFGNLVNLLMLDTRIVGRDEQLDYANYIGPGGVFNEAQFIADISDVNRTLMGFEQRAWLQNKLAVSSATWQVLGQQVLIGRMNLPAELLLSIDDPATAIPVFTELVTIKARILAGDPTVTDLERARVETVLPYNLDAWDGYAVEREVVLGTARALGKNLVVLAGDTHNSWANDLVDLAGNPVGVEFGGTSVTSPGFEELLQLPQPAWPQIEQGFELLIDGLKYTNIGDRGYMVVTFTADEAVTDWIYVDNILSDEYNLLPDRARSLKVVNGVNKLEEA